MIIGWWRGVKPKITDHGWQDRDSRSENEIHWQHRSAKRAVITRR